MKVGPVPHAQPDITWILKEFVNLSTLIVEPIMKMMEHVSHATLAFPLLKESAYPRQLCQPSMMRSVMNLKDQSA